MKNIINNNCSSNNTNNEINNNKSEVKTMRKITNNTINFNANALNSSIIASTISYAGNGYDGFLFGDDVNFEQLTAYCVLCEANHFEAPNNGIEGFARLAQVYCNTAPDKFGCVGVENVVTTSTPNVMKKPTTSNLKVGTSTATSVSSVKYFRSSTSPMRTTTKSLRTLSKSARSNLKRSASVMIRSMLTSPMPSLRVNTLSLRRIKKIAALRGRFFFIFCNRVGAQR